METELRRELEEQATRVREAEGRGEREQARLRSELRSKETAYKVTKEYQLGLKRCSTPPCFKYGMNNPKITRIKLCTVGASEPVHRVPEEAARATAGGGGGQVRQLFNC